MSSSDPNRQRLIRLVGHVGVWGVLLCLGLLVWLISLGLGDAHRAWRALLVNFIYFTPLAGGMAVWPAVITAARGGNWLNDSVRRHASAGVSFAPICFAVFFLLFLGRHYWAPWVDGDHVHNARWLNAPFLFGRDALGLVLFWWLAGRFARAGQDGQPKRLAGWLVFVYCVVFSLLGFDLVMALDPHWYSSLFGAYYFITGLYIALAAWTFTVLLQQPPVDEAHRKDLAKLVVAFSLLSTYMMFCQVLPIWYENLPEEVRFVIPRLRTSPWKWLSLALLASVYLGPLILLLPNRLKGSIRYLCLIAVVILVGMWLERWWLVTPTLGGRLAIGAPEIGMTAAFLAAFVLAVRRRNGQVPDLGTGDAT